jgi:hypothetical protein
VERSQRENKTVRELCNALFKDFEFGLGLIRNQKGQTEFEIPVTAIANPGKFLSDLVLASYPSREIKPTAGQS